MSNFPSFFNAKSEEEQEQFLREYLQLRLNNEEYEKLCKLLSNYYFIEAKINHPLFGVQALIEDYDLLYTSEIRNNSKYAEIVKALKLIQRALFSSTHIIFKDPKQVKAQLSARLTYFDLPEIKNLLAQIATDKNTGLYSLIGSLTPPGGGGLIRTLEGHSESVNAIALTPDGKTVISGSRDNTIKIWDLGTGQEKLTLLGHSHLVNAIAVTPDGKTVISGSFDKTIKIWDLVTGQEKFTLKGHDYSVNAIAVTPDGKTLISGSSDKTIKIWDLETQTEKLHPYRS
ncbi:WD40 repeat domain-containing protein [Anabaena sp. PCC 7108]|uniref:WD40 repeat domain-containing protein n=1 Tax=Anabaena sp. PCC 7108 TaxID=163908 RepID=UPI000347A7CC|nr:WD40 repeat domain-containing protein [Anabaena sp. PCC 7108]